MSFVKTLLAITAVLLVIIATGQAVVIDAGNGYSLDTPYTLISSTPIYITVNGLTFQGTLVDLYNDGSKTFIGTVTANNGTSINNPIGCGAAIGGAVALVGGDYTNGEFALDNQGAVNYASSDSAAKVGFPRSQVNSGKVMLVYASSSPTYGAQTVSVLNGSPLIEPGQALTYKASSF